MNRRCVSDIRNISGCIGIDISGSIALATDLSVRNPCTTLTLNRTLWDNPPTPPSPIGRSQLHPPPPPPPTRVQISGDSLYTAAEIYSARTFRTWKRQNNWLSDCDNAERIRRQSCDCDCIQIFFLVSFTRQAAYVFKPSSCRAVRTIFTHSW